MRGLTLHRPWDWAMAHGGKDIENRSWPAPAGVLGTRIALHAGKALDPGGAATIRAILRRDQVPINDAGLIVATTRVAGWVFRNELDWKRWSLDGTVAPADVYGSPWFFGPYGWVCRDTIALPEPVPCKGALGLWKLTADVEAEVLCQEQQARSKSA